MSPIPRPKLVAPGEGKTIMLFAVRFDPELLEERRFDNGVVHLHYRVTA